MYDILICEQMLEPDSSRSEIFSGLIFVFMDEGQYNNLQDPIAAAGGKVLFFDVRPGETTIEEYVEFVWNAAGRKRKSQASNEGLPVITIRLSNFPSDMENWATNFVTGVDQALNQRSVLQNEFLDAIIMKDVSSLQRSPTNIDVPSSAIGIRDEILVRETSVEAAQAPSEAPAEEPAPTQVSTKARKRRFQRGLTASRFTGFDEYEPPTKRSKNEDMSGVFARSPGPGVLLRVGRAGAATAASSSR